MKLGVIIGFCACSFAGAIGWYGFNALQPKNLKEYLEWQGFKLASSENTWKSIIKEHSEVAKSISVSSDNDIGTLSSWCESHLSLQEFSSYIDKATKLCTDNAGTIEAKLVRDGVDLGTFFKASEDDDKYKVAYAFRKHNSDFLSLIGHIPKEEEEEEFEPAVTKYKNWCQTILKAKLDLKLLESFQLFCKPKSFSTVQEYLNSLGFKLLVNGDDNGKLKDMWNKIKDFASYRQDIQDTKGNEEDLKKWCTENLYKKFSDSLEVIDDTLKKVKARCTEGGQMVDS